MFKILHISGITSGQKIDEIANVVDAVVRKGGQLKGIRFSASKNASSAKNNVLGRAGLWINNRSQHLGNFVVSSSLNKSQNANEAIVLNEVLKAHTEINGYYIDEGNATAYPYDLKIYLEYYG